MNIELPILVEERRDPLEGGSLYTVRPLFFAEPEAADRHLGRAMSKMADHLRKLLSDLGRSGRQRALAEYTFSPDLELRRVELRLELRSTSVRVWMPLATFHHFERHIVFCPLVPDVWFDAERKDAVATRAAEVFTPYFRKIEKEEGEDALQRQLQPFTAKAARPWITLLDLDVETQEEYRKPVDRRFASLADLGQMDGASELAKVGRCLDWLYPDRLERALLRDDLCDELDRLLAAANRRPVLLVGPPSVGKTALIHECLRRRVARRERPHSARENLWLISPQRLIAGMSYVGQWENRLLAILKTARKRGHVLYFDDLLGLYRAGVHSQSSLSVADVLKPYVERGDVRVLGEMTPEQLRIFRERDRGFADLFHLIPVPEPDEQETIRILIHVRRLLEGRHRVRFDAEVLPTVLELTRRYQREAAYPGKAARWLAQLAVKYKDAEVSRDLTLAEFRATSGLEATFLDARVRLKRQEIVAAMRTHLVGQQPAVEAMADVVSVAKARLNDPQRPLGSLFFLGPTGVGKTESAKALARYLFGDAARLLRFDMNEFVSPQSAARLVGTFEQPEGLLTSAVRRQPFCVVLLDEIEKAHPMVFDLLLQILGEARLTDALGRTADFSNAAVILTSNLGTREAGQAIGFGAQEGGDENVYLRAVQDFFRPEFFNRLDRIVPFARLGRMELELIARKVLESVLQREGLQRRRCAVDVTGDAIQWVVHRGYHPLLGARAMKRAIEAEMVQPLASQLAAISPDTPTVVRVFRAGERLGARVHPLSAAPTEASEEVADPQAFLAGVRRSLDCLEEECVRHRPRAELAAGRIPPEYSWYLGTWEYLKDTRRLVARVEETLRASRRTLGLPAIAVPQMRANVTRKSSYHDPTRQETLKALHAADDVYDYLQAISSRGVSPDDPQAWLRLIEERVSLLERMRPAEDGWSIRSALVVIRSLGDAPALRDWLAQRIAGRFVFQAGLDWDATETTARRRKASSSSAPAAVEFGLDCSRLRDSQASREDRVWWGLIADETQQGRYRASHHLDVLEFHGHNVSGFLESQQGTYLFAQQDGRLQPIQVVVRPLAEGEDGGAALLSLLAGYDRAIEAAAAGLPEDDANPFCWRPVKAVYTEPRDFKVDVELELSRL